MVPVDFMIETHELGMDVLVPLLLQASEVRLPGEIDELEYLPSDIESINTELLAYQGFKS
jgi:hypothetical protein